VNHFGEQACAMPKEESSPSILSSRALITRLFNLLC
jgi:hypothetical protein